jgi:predicted outer membrane repeat protein
MGLIVLALLLTACTQLRTREVEILHTRVSAAAHEFSSSIPGDSYIWSFGDGNEGVGRHVEHAYSKRGTYTVNLNVYHGVENFHAAVSIEVGHDWIVNGASDPSEVSVGSHKLLQRLQEAHDGDTVHVSGAFGQLVLDDLQLEIVGDATFFRIEYRSTGGILSGVTVTSQDYDQFVDPTPERSALILDHGSPQIERCTIHGNSVDGYGGGIYAFNSSATFIECEISENRAGQGGGGVYVYGSNAFPTFVSCTFRSNRADANGGAILMRSILDQPLSPETRPLHVEGCEFASNRARATFSGVPVAGGAIHIGFGGRAAIVDCTYSGNWPADVVFEDTYRSPASRHDRT